MLKSSKNIAFKTNIDTINKPIIKILFSKKEFLFIKSIILIPKKFMSVSFSIIIDINIGMEPIPINSNKVRNNRQIYKK